MAKVEIDPEQLLRRYLHRRDVGALGELFDFSAPQLARVAKHLVRDATEVEDLVQQTFLTALETAHKFEEGRRVMPWLLHILLNHARNSWRAASRRPDSLATEVVDTGRPDTDAERGELRDVVERAVADLPDRYRKVVSMGLFEGATPAEIAERTGKRHATVRVQLHRGLRLLRRGLPAGIAAALAAPGWSRASAARARSVVLARAAELAGTTVPIAAGAAAGAHLATVIWFTSAALLASAAALTWFATREPAQPRAVASAPRTVTPQELRDQDPTLSSPLVERSEAAAAPTSSPPPAPAIAKPRWTLVGTVAGDIGDEEARLRWGPDERWSFGVRGARFEIDLSELIVDRAAAALAYTFEYDHPRFMPATFQVVVPAQVDLDEAFASEHVELRARFEPEPVQCSVAGRVALPTGDDASRVRVALFALDDGGEPEASAADTAWCASDGSFCLRSPRSASHALLAALPGLRPATRIVPADAGGEVDVGTVALQTGERMSGRVRGVHGPGVVLGSSLDPGPQRRVDPPRSRVARAPETAEAFVWRGARFEWRDFSKSYGADGVFSVQGLAACEYRVRASAVERSAVEDRPDDGVTRVAFGASAAALDVAVPQEGVEWDAHERVVRFDVRAAGQPLEGATIALVLDGRERTSAAISGHLVQLRWSGDAPAMVRISKDGLEAQELSVFDASYDGFRIIDLR